MNILVFGGSITYGAWGETGGWADLLKEDIHKRVTADKFRSHAMVYNLAISGDTTSGVLKRFRDEASIRVGSDGKIIIIFAVGINDSQFLIDKKEHRTSDEVFQNNIVNLLQQAREFTEKFVFIGFTPVDDDKLNPIPWNPIKIMKNEYIKRYDEMLRGICERENVKYIELFNRASEAGYQAHLVDGIHPDDEGHKIIFEAVKGFLETEQWLD